MGGKHKQAQRTKNNVKPSSSGRSAELLGSSVPKFVGFSAVEDGVGFRPFVPGFSSFPSTSKAYSSEDPGAQQIDANFQLVLKKMSKKDSTTKLKAVQEFTDLVEKAENSDSLKPVLPFWPHVYCSLALDVDHRVREASHVAQRSVALKAKKNLAPFLKQIAGPWFTSQYDCYAPAATAAQQAFNDAFPPNKVADVILFCQDEVLNYICDNLTGQNQCLNKNLSEEDQEARTQRLLISSLQGYSWYLQKVPPKQLESALELNKKIISNAQFWKLSKHQTSNVRAAWFITLSAMLQRAPHSFLADEGERVTKTVLANLDETDPVVLSTVWETALLALFTVQDWWTHINIDKLVLPKLWRVLREAAQGNAASIYPNLLPLISKFPPGSDAHAFYTNFFDNVRAGFKQKSVEQSRSELASVVNSFIECLQYVILTHQSDNVLCELLLKNQLMKTIEWCLLEGHYASKTLFNQVASLVGYWNRNRLNSETPNYQTLLKQFWDFLLEIYTNIINVEIPNKFDNEIKFTILTKQVDLLFSLKRNQHNSSGKKQVHKVQFVISEEENAKDVDQVDVANVQHCEINQSDLSQSLPINDFLVELNQIAYAIAKIYLDNIDKSGIKIDGAYLFHLHSIIQEFESIEIFHHISNGKKLIDLFIHRFLPWLKSEKNSEIIDNIIDLLFILFKYLNFDEKEIFLSSISSCQNRVILKTISHGLAHPYRNEGVIRTWLKTDVVSKFLEEAAIEVTDENLAANASPDLMPLLRLACTAIDSSDLLISDEVLQRIVQVFCRPLNEPQNYETTVDTSARFAAVLAAFLYSDINVANLSQNSNEKVHEKLNLLIALFNFNVICTTEEIALLTDDTLWEINTSWQDALAVLRSEYAYDSPIFCEIIERFVKIIREALSQENTDIECLIDRTYEIILSAKISNDEISGLMKIFLKHFQVVDQIKAIAQLALSADIICGKLSFYSNECHVGKYFLQDEVSSETTCYSSINLSNIPRFINFNLNLMLKFFKLSQNNKKDEENEENDSDDDEEDDNLQEFNIDEIFSRENIYGIVENLFVFSVMNLYSNYYKISENYYTIGSSLPIINENIKLLLTNLLTTKHYAIITEEIISKARALGGLWTHVLYNFYKNWASKLNSLSLQQVYSNYVKDFYNESDLLPWLHLTQLFAPHISWDDVDLFKKPPLECISVVAAIRKNDDQSTVFLMEALGIVKSLTTKSDMLQEKKITKEIDGKTVETVTEIIRFLTSVIVQRSIALSSTHWDFIVISLYGWANTVKKSINDSYDVSILSMGAAVFDMFIAINEFMKSITNDVAAGQGYQKLVNEWNDVAYGEINREIVEIYVELLKRNDRDKWSPLFIPLLQHMCPCIHHMNINELIIEARAEESQLITVLVQLLCSTIPEQQFAAHSLLQFMFDAYMVPLDLKAISAESSDKEELSLSMMHFKRVLDNAQMVVDAMLQEFKVGEETCLVRPHTETYEYTTGYLLIWDILLSMIREAQSQLRNQYSDWIRENNYLRPLMNNILRLMPDSIIIGSSSTTNSTILFSTKPDISINEPRTSEWVEHFACSIYNNALTVLPVLTRQWWSSTEPRIARSVQRITEMFVSPSLCEAELNHIRSKNMDPMEIKVYSNIRQVIASYIVDDVRMELSITLPNNYPLEVVKISQIGTSIQSRNSFMKVSLFLTHRNAGIIDGLILWKNDLDRKFDGVAECYICFSVIHAATCQLPKLTCQTCKKKFHSKCLYTWFSTSNKSTCPICRNLF